MEGAAMSRSIDPGRFTALLAGRFLDVGGEFDNGFCGSLRTDGEKREGR
jgi:hypothetical protein